MSSPPCSRSSRPRHAARLRQLKARGAQRAREPDERQADEGRRILALDAVEESDTQGLGLEAAGAIERPLARDVTIDLTRRQRPEDHGGGVDVSQMLARACAEQHAGGVEMRGVAGEARELRAAAWAIARLVEKLTATVRHLVAADHERLRLAGAHGLRLGGREAQRTIGRGFPGKVLLADPGRHHLEVECEAREELSAVGGGRGEDQLRHASAQACESPSRNNGLAPNPALTWEDSIPIIRAPCRSPGRGRSKWIGWLTAEPRSTSPFRSRSCPV